MKRVAAVITAVIILLSAFAVYGIDSGKLVQDDPGKTEQQLSNKTVQELLQEVDILLYRTLPVKESEEKALGVLDQIIKLDPKCKQAYSYKAYALYSLGRGNEAVSAHDEALKAMPDDGELYYSKSDYLMRLKRYKEALVCFDKMLKSKNAEFLRMYSDSILEGKATALYELKRYKEAIKVYDKLIAASGYYYSFDDGMKKGMALMELKRYSEAAKWFNDFKKHVVLQNSGQLGKVYYYSACAYSMLGNTAQATAELESAIKFDKSYKTNAKTEKYFGSMSKNKSFASVLTFEEDLLKELKFGEGFYMIDHLTYDINGDNADDEVALVGHKSGKEWINTDKIVLVIIDNKSGKHTVINPKYAEGIIYSDYQHYLLPYDLNGDGVKDVAIELGGLGGSLYSAYSFKDNKSVMIFGNEAISEGLSFSAKRIDNNTASIKCTEFDKTLIVDLTVAERDKGKLDEPGRVSRFWQVEFVDIDGDKVYELKGHQGVNGFGGIYGYGSIITTLKYDKAKAEWVILNVEYKWGK